jgi:hypothetical protein
MSGDPRSIFSETQGGGNRNREQGNKRNKPVPPGQWEGLRKRFAVSGIEDRSRILGRKGVNVFSGERRPGLGRQGVSGSAV